MARLGIKKYNEAKEDFQEVLRLEPFNKAAQQELIKIEKELESMSIVFAVDKPIEKRSKKPLKRIEIQEINGDVDKKLEAARHEINSKIKLNENDEKLFSLNARNSLISEIGDKSVDEVKIKRTEEIQIPKEEKKSIAKSFVIPPAPTNGFQFRKDWQILVNNFEDLCTYFKVRS